MTDQELLAGYIAVGRRAIDDFLALLEQLPNDAWNSPTDLPGWDVKAVASHVAHLESVLAGDPEPTVELGDLPHLTAPTGDYTERGVVARRDHAPADIIREIRESADARFAALEADPPTDASAKPVLGVPGLSWDWRTLLRNRPLDVWMHEQDIRRAVGLPGGFDTAPAEHTVRYFAESLGFVVAKRGKATAGTSVVFALNGLPPLAVGVGENGRGSVLRTLPEQPDVRIDFDAESFIVLAGGRRPADPQRVRVTGDEQLAGRILAGMTVTG
ncbi:maleylpyruvate isomerase family mycothiol-dependent enzyme [Salinibacterium sp. GXW1014]|uniref:maleylpyruvate isomerase family mycothiol-dependent enzyme n=1 Tax=Salinibacterium sp. GXW1014 TaxID=3377838 RepID=UPI00383AF1CA